MNNSLFNDDGYKKQIITVGIIFLVIVFVIIGLVANNSSKDYIIINKSLILTKSGTKYKQIKRIDEDILSQKYNVYTDDNIYKNVTIKIEDNVWYYFDEDYNDLNLNIVPVAYTKKFNKLKAIPLDTSYYEDSDDDYIKEVTKKEDIESFKGGLIKNSFDLDGDGTVEHIYTISNESLSGDSSGNYSSIFLVKGDTLIGKLDNNTETPYLVQAIIDLDGNGKYEVIVSKGTIDMATFDTCYQIYSIKGKKIKLIKDC